MNRVLSVTSFAQERQRNSQLAYWLSRPPEERIAEVERLRREYLGAFGGVQRRGVQKDFADLCALWNANHVESLIIGGYAVAFHGAPRLGEIPIQIHLMTSATGITWDMAWGSRREGTYAPVPVLFIGREALIANKRATGRSKDAADIEALERLTQ